MMTKKMKLSIFIVIGIIIISLLTGTFAYYVISASSENNIEGRTINFGVSLTTQGIYQATSLIPLSNNLVQTAISKETNKCVDKNGRDVCSLYSLTLSNTGDNIKLTPYITTINSTFTTNNLKCQIYNSNFSAVSDVMTLSNISNNKMHITSSGNNLSINVPSTNQVYYLVIWLTDTNSSQSADYTKTYNGTITFDGGDANGRVQANFSS